MSKTKHRLKMIVKSYRKYIPDYVVVDAFNKMFDYQKPSTLERRLREIREAGLIQGKRIKKNSKAIINYRCV